MFGQRKGRGTRQERGMTPAVTSGTTGDDSQGMVFNRSALLSRIGGNVEMIPRFVDMFLESVEDCLPKLEEAISTKNLEAVKTVIHTLKGVSGNIGAERMHGVVLEIGSHAASGDMENLLRTLTVLREEFELFKSGSHNCP